VERYTTHSLTGDTANVWEGSRCIMLIPYAPYNRFQFVQKADTSYHKGDHFILAFRSNYLYQSGAKDAIVYIALKYENDSIVSKVTRFSVSGDTQLRFDACDLKVKEVMGYFYLGAGNEKNTELKLLFLTDINFIRFHKQETDKSMKPANEVIKADTTKTIPDSVMKRQRHQFGVKPVSR
jgi:hypothetical protein